MERTKTGEFNWLDLSAEDFEAQSAFYAALFGWVRFDVPLAEGRVYGMFYKGDHRVAGISQLAPEVLAAGAPTAWNTYVATNDVDATVSRSLELGATIAMPPMDVTGSGRMAAIQDPSGGFVFFWKPDSPEESINYYEPGTLAWNDLNTRDPQKAADFYTALLGWRIEKREPGGPMPYWVISVDGQGQGGIMPMPEMVPAEVPSFWMPYFGSADLATDMVKATELGATVLVEPMGVEDTVLFAVLNDPRGATFALMQYL
jgi:predicted enzyme related to lactoylglutathione lyase